VRPEAPHDIHQGPAVRALQGLTWGMRNPFDGPVFETIEEAEDWCIAVMDEHYYSMEGLSDAKIEPFSGMVDA